MVILLTFVALVFYYVGHSTSPQKVPRNCAELAVTYLEMGKTYYGLSPDNNEEWNEAVDKETKIQNICLEQFSKQYPWDY